MYEPFNTAHIPAKMKYKLRQEGRRQAFLAGLNPDNRDFTCAHCRQPVSAERLIAVVGNRNHCPYCLWSRHMDLIRPGDRLCACKQPMPAVALTFKRTAKKYSRGRGELMLVHACLSCGTVSANRLAADDDPDQVMTVFEACLRMKANEKKRFASAGIDTLAEMDRQLVEAQLFGEVAWSGNLEAITEAAI